MERRSGRKKSYRGTGCKRGGSDPRVVQLLAILLSSSCFPRHRNPRSKFCNEKRYISKTKGRGWATQGLSETSLRRTPVVKGTLVLAGAMAQFTALLHTYLYISLFFFLFGHPYFVRLLDLPVLRAVDRVLAALEREPRPPVAARLLAFVCRRRFHTKDVAYPAFAHWEGAAVIL